MMTSCRITTLLVFTYIFGGLPCWPCGTFYSQDHEVMRPPRSECIKLLLTSQLLFINQDCNRQFSLHQPLTHHRIRIVIIWNLTLYQGRLLGKFCGDGHRFFSFGEMLRWDRNCYSSRSTGLRILSKNFLAG